MKIFNVFYLIISANFIFVAIGCEQPVNSDDVEMNAANLELHRYFNAVKSRNYEAIPENIVPTLRPQVTKMLAAYKCYHNLIHSTKVKLHEKYGSKYTKQFQNGAHYLYYNMLDELLLSQWSGINISLNDIVLKHKDGHMEMWAKSHKTNLILVKINHEWLIDFEDNQTGEYLRTYKYHLQALSKVLEYLLKEIKNEKADDNDINNLLTLSKLPPCLVEAIAPEKLKD